MRLVRFATVFLNKRPLGLERASYEAGRVSVDVQDVSSGDVPRLLLQAATSLDARPDISPEGEVTIPEPPRKEVETVIEAVANLLAVLNHSHRRICSPHPFVALRVETEEEIRWTSCLKGFAGQQSGTPRTTFRLPSTPEHLAAVSDRIDGVALLAEALTNQHSTGKFHEFMRLFERAFTLSPSQFEKKLAQSLQGADLGYDRSEVKHWIALRNPATHANDTTLPYIALESDIRPVIDRIEQAAYDVLWNKKFWQDRSTETRPVWRPSVATDFSTYNVVVTKGLEASFIIQTLDPLRAFPFDQDFRLPEMPPHFWSSWNQHLLMFSGPMRVREHPGNAQH